jgi:hypothetical protein
MVLPLNPSIVVLLPPEEIDHGIGIFLCLLESTNKNQNAAISVLKKQESGMTMLTSLYSSSTAINPRIMEARPLLVGFLKRLSLGQR